MAQLAQQQQQTAYMPQQQGVLLFPAMQLVPSQALLGIPQQPAYPQQQEMSLFMPQSPVNQGTSYEARQAENTENLLREQNPQPKRP